MTNHAAVASFRARFGPVGVWLAPPTLTTTAADDERRIVSRLDELGYGSVWTGEHIGGKDVFTHVGLWLAATNRIAVGTGVANIWCRHPAVMHGAAATLADAYPGRFALAVGVSAPVLVEMSGQTFDRPVDRMRDYLVAMEGAAAHPPVPAVPFPRLMAALGPRMLGLAREHADGTHPFLAPPEHTAVARDALGPDQLVVAHLPFILEDDRGVARDAARSTFGPAFAMPNSSYVLNLLRVGLTRDDLLDGGSDRLIDALVAYGGPQDIAKRLADHLDAGADHVLLHPIDASLSAGIDDLAAVAPAMPLR